MKADFTFTSSDVLMWMAFVFIAIVAIVAFLKMYFKKQSGENLTEKYRDKKWNSPLEARSKYPDVDIFKMRGLVFNVSLVLVFTLILAAINWTIYEDEIYIPKDALTLEEDIEIEPPRSDIPPPPPPPPPPPVIQEVPQELIPEDEAPEFVDQSISEETVINAPVQETKAAAAPPPPPPPPPKPVVEEIFKVVEQMPRFAGCEDLAGSDAEKKTCAEKKMLEFVYEHIKYPNVARENGIEGMVVIQFVVASDGAIQDARIVRDIGGQCGEEALRIVKMMPKWIPGRQRGKPVKVLFNLPVKFELKGNQS